MPEPLLPELVNNPTGMPPTTQKGWNFVPIASLKGVGDNLAAPNDVPPSVLVDAIPAVWGKALVFAYALHEAEHPFHRAAVAAFRGLLAMLALRKRRGYKVEAIQVDLAQSTPAGHRFREAVGSVPPKEVMSDHLNWNKPHIFLFEGEVVGMTSPATLVCPREGGDMPRASARKLTDGYRYIDPIEHMTAEEAGLVARWIEDLRSGLPMGAAVHAWLNMVYQRLNEFEAALIAKAGGAGQGYELDGDALNLPAGGPYGRLRQSIKFAGVPPGAAYTLKLKADRPEARPHLVVYCEDAAEQLGMPEHAVMVTPSVSLSAVRGQNLGENRNMIGTVQLPPQTEWVRPEELLLRELVLVQAHDAFVDVLRIDGSSILETEKRASAILPLNPRLAHYFDPQTLRRNCSFSLRGTSIEFQLRLPVGDGTQKLTARRVYEEKDIVYVDPERLPLFEIWPRCRLNNWKAYFTYWDRFAVARGAIHMAAHPVVAPGLLAQEKRGSQLSLEVRRLEAPPEYIQVSELADGSDEVRRCLGLLIPRYDDAPAVVGSVADIGFDFGTTNTNIFMRVGGSEPAPLKLEIATVQVCKKGAAARDAWLYGYFLPAGGTETAPFLSLLRLRPGAMDGNEPVTDAHVYFYRYFESSTGRSFDEDNVRAHLKWEASARAQKDRSLFLNQLALVAAAEARRRGATTIKYRVSYPTAFSGTAKGQQEASWAVIKAKLDEITGAGTCAVEKAETESIAAAYYFMNLQKDKAQAGVGMVVADIGGGTSDVSIWQDQKLRVQSSLRLSGQEMLIEPIFSLRDRIGGALCGNLTAHRRAAFECVLSKETGLPNFRRQIDALLRDCGEVILQGLVNHIGSPDFERLRSEICVRMAGLFYHMGQMCRFAAWTRLEDGRLPDVFLGGNGSRVMDWLQPPHFEQGGELEKLLTICMAAGAGMNAGTARLQIRVSKEPKSEAAKGLLHLGQGGNLAAERGREAVVSGEAFVSGGDSRGSCQDLTPKQLALGVEVSQLNELRLFLEAYNQAVHSVDLFQRITNAPDVIEKGKDYVVNYCRQQAGKDEEAVELSPLFVMGLLGGLPVAKWS